MNWLMNSRQYICQRLFRVQKGVVSGLHGGKCAWGYKTGTVPSFRAVSYHYGFDVANVSIWLG